MLQGLNPVLPGGPSHRWHSPALPRTLRTDEAGALPSPAVVLSARLQRYYGRLRRPPGSPPTSRRRPVIGRDAPAALRRLPGRGGPPQFPPSPSERSAPHTPGSPWRLHSRLFTASMAFTLISGARHSLSPTQRAGPLTTRQASRDATDRSVASPTGLSTLGFDPAFPPSRQPATGPPGSYPDRTHTGRRRRACDGSAGITSNILGARKIQASAGHRRRCETGVTIRPPAVALQSFTRLLGHDPSPNEATDSAPPRRRGGRWRRERRPKQDVDGSSLPCADPDAASWRWHVRPRLPTGAPWPWRPQAAAVATLAVCPDRRDLGSAPGATAGPPHRERGPAGGRPRRPAGEGAEGLARMIDAAVASVMAHDRAAALAGVTRHTIYF